MSETTQSALRVVACIAFRHIAELPEYQREQVLVALVEVLPETEAVHAQEALYHLREQRKCQLTLKAILEGIGK